MKLSEIIAKVAKGEQLTDEERSFLGGDALQKELDSASASARKKAESKAAESEAKLTELQQKLAELEAKGNPAATEMQKLQKRLENLEKAKAEAEAKLAAQSHSAAIRKIAADNQISAAKGINAELFSKVFESAFDGVDLDDAEAVKTALQTFRDGNPAMISVGGIGGADSKGKGGIGLRPATNPFAKKTFNLTEQIKLQMEQPELAKTLAAEAASQG